MQIGRNNWFRKVAAGMTLVMLWASLRATPCVCPDGVVRFICTRCLGGRPQSATDDSTAQCHKSCCAATIARPCCDQSSTRDRLSGRCCTRLVSEQTMYFPKRLVEPLLDAVVELLPTALVAELGQLAVETTIFAVDTGPPKYLAFCTLRR